MKHINKILLGSIIALAFPLTLFAYTGSWSYTSTSSPAFSPTAVFGKFANVVAPYFTATSTTATSTFAHDVNITGNVGANTFNISTTTTSATQGVITQSGVPVFNLLGTGTTQNLFIGPNAGNFTASGANNVGIGRVALNNLTTGNGNFALGDSAEFNLTTASNNIAIGKNGLVNLVIGIQNTSINASMASFTSGDRNTAVGYASLDQTSGTNNTGIGHEAGYQNTTGSYNVYIGESAAGRSSSFVNNLTNSIAIGYNSSITQSNSMALGGLGANAVKVGIGTSSPISSLTVIGDGYFAGTLTATSTATSTFSGSIKSPCFTNNGTTCISGAGGAGTVTSVDMSVPTGLSISGNPITAAGTLALSLTSGYNIPLTASTTNWNTVYNNSGTYLTSVNNGNWSGTDLAVGNGGTGASTLTGCLTGNGTGAITGSGTCNTSAASVTSVGLSSTNSTLTIGSSPVTTSGTITADLNLAHANTWTGLQAFSNTATTTFAGSVQATAGTIVNNEYAPATSTTMTIDWTKGTQQLVKLGHAAVTINMSAYIAGQVLRIPLCQDNSGGATVTWDSKIMWASSTPPTLSGANHCDLMTFVSTAGTSTTYIMGGYINF